MKQVLHFKMEGLGIILHKIQNTVTIINEKEVVSSSRKMKFLVSPITHATVQSKVAFDLSKSVKILKHLAKSDSVVIYIIEEPRENDIARRIKE